MVKLIWWLLFGPHRHRHVWVMRNDYPLERPIKDGRVEHIRCVILQCQKCGEMSRRDLEYGK